MSEVRIQNDPPSQPSGCDSAALHKHWKDTSTHTNPTPGRGIILPTLFVALKGNHKQKSRAIIWGVLFLLSCFEGKPTDKNYRNPFGGVLRHGHTPWHGWSTTEGAQTNAKVPKVAFKKIGSQRKTEEICGGPNPYFDTHPCAPSVLRGVVWLMEPSTNLGGACANCQLSATCGRDTAAIFVVLGMNCYLLNGLVLFTFSGWLQEGIVLLLTCTFKPKVCRGLPPHFWHQIENCGASEPFPSELIARLRPGMAAPLTSAPHLSQEGGLQAHGCVLSSRAFLLVTGSLMEDRLSYGFGLANAPLSSLCLIICVFSPVGFKRNLSLLNIISFLFQGLKQMEAEKGVP